MGSRYHDSSKKFPLTNVLLLSVSNVSNKLFMASSLLEAPVVAITGRARAI